MIRDSNPVPEGSDLQSPAVANAAHHPVFVKDQSQNYVLSITTSGYDVNQLFDVVFLQQQSINILYHADDRNHTD